MVRRTPRTARALDPQGIYDARSLARRQAARRRRTASTLFLLALGAALGAASIFKGREARVPSWQPERAIDIGLESVALAPASVFPLSPPPRPSATPRTPRTEQRATTGAREAALVVSGRDGRMAIVHTGGTAAVSTWRASDFSLRSPALIARDGTRTIAVVGGEDGVARAFNLATRREIWKSVGASPISGRPVLLDSPAPFSNTSVPGAKPSSQLIAVGDDGGVVRALRLHDGQVMWSVRLGAPCGDGLSWARVRGGRALIFVPLLSGGGRRGGVAAVDAASGRVAWRFPRDERVFAATSAPPLPRSLDGRTRLFCADTAGTVVALDAALGRSPLATQASSNSRARGSGEWKAFLAPLLSPAPSGSKWRDSLGAGSTASSLAREPALPGAAVLPGALTPEAGEGEASRALLVSVRLEPLWVSARRGPLLLVAGNDGGVRAFEARSGRPAWGAAARESPVALLQAPPLEGVATIAVVTPHSVERRSAEDGRTLARFEWREDEGTARCAAATPTHLVVGGEELILFPWASST
jgi:outer membrane protein assembly factor BamB